MRAEQLNTVERVIETQFPGALASFLRHDSRVLQAEEPPRWMVAVSRTGTALSVLGLPADAGEVAPELPANMLAEQFFLNHERFFFAKNEAEDPKEIDANEARRLLRNTEYRLSL